MAFDIYDHLNRDGNLVLEKVVESAPYRLARRYPELETPFSRMELEFEQLPNSFLDRIWIGIGVVSGSFAEMDLKHDPAFLYQIEMAEMLRCPKSINGSSRYSGWGSLSYLAILDIVQKMGINYLNATSKPESREFWDKMGVTWTDGLDFCADVEDSIQFVADRIHERNLASLCRRFGRDISGR
ncbi:hypothetical protein JW968_00150 [Candidatus Woesearchaeota archaeon]|nr:hypothetical protein [Candidatus Woesearchaeota archaeon]